MEPGTVVASIVCGAAGGKMHLVWTYMELGSKAGNAGLGNSAQKSQEAVVPHALGGASRVLDIRAERLLAVKSVCKPLGGQ